MNRKWVILGTLIAAVFFLSTTSFAIILDYDYSSMNKKGKIKDFIKVKGKAFDQPLDIGPDDIDGKIAVRITHAGNKAKKKESWSIAGQLLSKSKNKKPVTDTFFIDPEDLDELGAFLEDLGDKKKNKLKLYGVSAQLDYLPITPATFIEIEPGPGPGPGPGHGGGDPAPVPEPGTLALLGVGMVAMGGVIRRKIQRQ